MSKPSRILGLVASALTAGRDALLYHSTMWVDLISIFKDNKLKGGNVHHSGEPQEFRTRGVSLTRSLPFASQWQKGASIVLVLDQTKLTQNKKIIPRDYWGQDLRKPDGNNDKNYIHHEAEEFVPGEIDNLAQYLLGVIIPEKTKKTLENYGNSPETLLEFCNVALSIGLTSSQDQQWLVSLREKTLAKANTLRNLYGLPKISGRDAPIYHATTAKAAVSIITDNKLKGQEWANRWEEDFFKTDGVSFTRDKKFAESWAEVVFVLDQARLAQDRKIRPRDYFGPEGFREVIKTRTPRRNEKEEYVPTDIPNLDRYLLRIYLAPDVMRTFGEYWSDNEYYLSKLVKHPKFDPQQKELIQKLEQGVAQ